MVAIDLVAGRWSRSEQSKDVRSGRFIRLEKIRDNMVSSGGHLGLGDNFLLATGGKTYFGELMVGTESEKSFEIICDILKMSQEGSKAREVFSDLMSSQLGFLENSVVGDWSKVENRPLVDSQTAMRSVLMLHKQGNWKQKEATREVVARNVERFAELAKGDQFDESRFLAYCSERALEVGGAVYRDILLNTRSKDNHDLVSVINGTFENLQYQSRTEAKNNLMTVVNSMVFRNYLGCRNSNKEGKILDDVVNSWLTVNYKDPDVFNYMFEGWPSPVHGFLLNMITARCLVANNGKECLFGLYRRFGITHFGRYGSEFLSRQWDGRDSNVQDITGVFLGAYSDWNTAFYKRREEFASFVQSVREQGRRLVVVEARNKLAIARRLLSVSKRSGLIDFLVIAAHGSPAEMSFGRGYAEGDYVDIQDTLHKTTEKIGKKSYRSGMPILFHSCSVGKMNGIAHHFAYRLNTTAIGPDKPAHIQNYKLEVDENGNSSFVDVAYVDSELRAYSFNK